eukprot:843212-Pelagomonas_calceolata.AAC.1
MKQSLATMVRPQKRRSKEKELNIQRLLRNHVSPQQALRVPPTLPSTAKSFLHAELRTYRSMHISACSLLHRYMKQGRSSTKFHTPAGTRLPAARALSCDSCSHISSRAWAPISLISMPGLSRSLHKNPCQKGIGAHQKLACPTESYKQASVPCAQRGKACHQANRASYFYTAPMQALVHSGLDRLGALLLYSVHASYCLQYPAEASML